MKSEMNRRELLTLAATAACICCLGNSAEILADVTTGPTTVDVGPKTAFATDGITTTWSQDNKFAIIRHGGKLYATSTKCTHKGATIKSDDGIDFECPRHHATYDIDGNVTKGPAKRPLMRYAITVNDAGHVIVDKTKTFETPDTWTDPESFITLA